MTKILIGHSYFLHFDPKLWAAMQPYPPLGTLYAASLLRQHGYDVTLFDAMLAESEEEWAAALVRERPNVAIIYEDNFNYLSKMCLLRMRQTAYAMIDMARSRGCHVIVCGADATDHAPDYLSHGADFVLLGEGENTLVELLDTLLGKGQVPYDQIRGLAYPQAGTRMPMCTPRRPEIRDLDALPFPAWDLVDLERYRRVWLKRHGYFSLNMVTTRGCPYHCNWCAKPIWGQRYNSRSPQNVAAELKWLKESCHPDHIWFMDDIFGLKPGWIGNYANQVKELDCRVSFKCLSRVDLLLRQGEIANLKQAGCECVWVGAESGSQKILDAMEKGTQVSQIHETTQGLHAAGIKVGYFLQFGYPGETRQDIEMTLQLVRQSRPDEIGMSVSYPMPGTRFYETVRQQLGVKQNWDDSGDMAMLYHGPYSTAFYRQLHSTLHHEFRARKHARELVTLLRHPHQVSPRHMMTFAAMSYHALTLPLQRLRLKQLEHSPHQGVGLLPPALSNAQAATPSAQVEA